MSDANGLSIEKRALSGAAAHFGSDRALRTRRWGVWYVCEHRLRTLKTYLATLVLGSVFNPVMYLFALGVGIGSYVDRSGNSAGIDVSYLTFVGPALLASAGLTAAFEESSFPIMGGFKWTREFYSMHHTSLRPRQIAWGMMLSIMIRVIFTCGVFWTILKISGALPSALAPLSLLASLLGALGVGSLIAAFAASLKEDDGWFALINRMVLAPLFLFSGTFYPLEQMPSYLHWIGWISPLWHATEFGRWAGYGKDLAAGQILTHAVYLLMLAVVGVYLVARQFTRRLEE